MPRNCKWYVGWFLTIRPIWTLLVLPAVKHRISVVLRHNPVPCARQILNDRWCHRYLVKPNTSNVGWTGKTGDHQIRQDLSSRQRHHKWLVLRNVCMERENQESCDGLSGILDCYIDTSEFESIRTHRTHAWQSAYSGHDISSRPFCTWDKGIHCCQVKIYCPTRWKTDTMSMVFNHESQSTLTVAS